MKHISGKHCNQSGFSLVELMIVVGIIGVLATLALPRFKQFQAKAKLAETQNFLSHIYTLEQSFALDNNTFIDVPAYGAVLTAIKGCTVTANQIGFSIDPCNATSPTPRFSYAVTGSTAATFVARGSSGDLVNNRVCAGNRSFSILIDNTNQTRWTVGTAGAGTAGTAPIGTICGT